MTRKHSHYFKPVPAGVTHIDVYRVLEMFGVTDQALGHAAKKILVAGGRGSKDVRKDIQEAIDTLQRKLEMLDEDAGVFPPYVGEDRRASGAPPMPYCSYEKLCGQRFIDSRVACRNLPRSQVSGG